MTYNKLTHEYLPYEILWRVTDAKGDWGGWKVHSKHWSDDERDQELAKLRDTGWRQYKRHDNQFELERQREAVKRVGTVHNAVI